MPAMFG